jgi:hypothetical protein
MKFEKRNFRPGVIRKCFESLKIRFVKGKDKLVNVNKKNKFFNLTLFVDKTVVEGPVDEFL